MVVSPSMVPILHCEELGHFAGHSQARLVSQQSGYTWRVCPTSSSQHLGDCLTDPGSPGDR